MTEMRTAQGERRSWRGTWRRAARSSGGKRFEGGQEKRPPTHGHRKRGAVAASRLSQHDDGTYRYDLKRPLHDGRTCLVWMGEQLVRKLVPLVPPLFANLTRFHGVFAPRVKLRARIIPQPEEQAQTRDSAAMAPATRSPAEALSPPCSTRCPERGAGGPSATATARTGPPCYDVSSWWTSSRAHSAREGFVSWPRWTTPTPSTPCCATSGCSMTRSRTGRGNTGRTSLSSNSPTTLALERRRAFTAGGGEVYAPADRGDRSRLGTFCWGRWGTRPHGAGGGGIAPGRRKGRLFFL